VFIRPRDLLKLGQLYLNGGIWNGKRIVPQSWVALSTAKHIEWPYRNQNLSAGTDGYMWHLNAVKSGGREYREYEANGNGGQLLMVFPELDLAIVFTAGNYQNGGVWGRFRDEIVGKAIIPAISRLKN
jgi:Beta-lactamase class C and other penicillin binding proteins